MPSLLPIMTAVCGTICFGLGLNAFFNPVSALSVFGLPAPTTAEGKLIFQIMGPVYGARDIFMAVAMWATAIYGSRRAMGWIVLATGAIAGVDGALCKWIIGKGEWSHWGFVPISMILGMAILVSGDEGVKGKTEKKA